MQCIGPPLPGPSLNTLLRTHCYSTTTSSLFASTTLILGHHLWILDNISFPCTKISSIINIRQFPSLYSN